MINDNADVPLLTLEQREGMFVPVVKRSESEVVSCAARVCRLVHGASSSSGAGLSCAGLGSCFPVLWDMVQHS